MLGAKETDWLRRIGLGALVLTGLLAGVEAAVVTAGPLDETLRGPSAAFEPTWDWVQLSSKAFNGVAREELKLTVHGSIVVLDDKDLLGMCVNDPNVLQAIDGGGNVVAWQAVPSSHIRSYQPLAYHLVHEPLDLTGTWRAYPYEVSVQLLLDPNEAPPASVSLLNWSVLGLYAEQVVEVDVPFKVSEGWQEVTPGVYVRVKKAQLECDETRYAYRTEVECRNGSLGAFNDRLAEAERIADYVVLESLLVDSQGSPLVERKPRPVPSIFWSELTQSTPIGTVACSGMLVRGKETDIARIRHVIAIHPVEVQVPLVWKDLPVPSFLAEAEDRK